ncbi:dipicolinate synthase subunit B [Evtepia sp.]|nr:dipicolinate synthase subunit B [Candidatus Evtepia faecavium]
MEQPRVGFALTGSFCTLDKALRAMEETAQAYPDILPILSETTGSTDTRFGRGEDFRQAAEEICGRRAVASIREAEPIGPRQLLDVLVIAPCTGNTLAKLAAGVADTAVTMAAKAHLRNGRPVVVAVSTNDGLGGAARNIGELLCRKHYYFVPFRQDDPVGKPTSLVADMDLVPATVAAALRGEQLQPLLLGPAEG